MKHVLGFIIAFIVTLVAFSGWYGGNGISMVEAEFAPILTAEVVITDGTTAHVLSVEVEITTTAEVLSAAVFDFYETPIAWLGGNLIANRDRHPRYFWTDPALQLQGKNRYMTHYGFSARRPLIGYTMRYLT